MNVADLGQSLGFYRDVFDFTLLSKDEELAMVSATLRSSSYEASGMVMWGELAISV
jgi:hypothetical protein